MEMAASASIAGIAAARDRRRALLEIVVVYGLILAVIWTPRPLQRFLWVVAVAAVAAIAVLTWPGAAAIGLRRANFLRSFWIVAVALALAGAALVVAAHLRTLGLPVPPAAGLAAEQSLRGRTFLFVRTYWGYALWTFVQQFLLQGFFLARLRLLLANPRRAALAAAGLFALAHVPNPILAALTLVWGTAACLLFLRYGNLYSLAIAHAIFGITLAITVPGPVLRNMRVGLGYLAYAHRHAHLLEPQRPDGVH